ncbi:MAG: chitobiase/beta-hexosaminidase C-terminal domain-containing protein [Saprospiraceae bacterium]|nr:chitobiase/beta-hexosaminidase C-terminal domain-containing protein [Saprospiraceae bacterium]
MDAGFYSGSVSVSLSTDPGFTIRYTTNGSEPTTTSTLYAAPINFFNTTVLKARAFSSNTQILPGFVMFHTYFINVNHTVPVVSIAGNNIMSLMNGTQGTPFGSFEYFENNMLESDGYGELNKHGNDSWAYPQRGIDWITRDQLGYDDELNHKFFPDRTRKKFQRLILKAAANDNYPSTTGAHIRDSYVHTLALQGGLNIDVRTHLSCVMYVNGQYWGVYDLREKADDSDFTKYYYDQDEFDIDYIKTWGNTWEEYGDWTDWYTLKAFILGNNMANPANYASVEQELDFLSLIDYIIINQHSVCKDWLNWNTSWWRGNNTAGGALKLALYPLGYGCHFRALYQLYRHPRRRPYCRSL